MKLSKNVTRVRIIENTGERISASSICIPQQEVSPVDIEKIALDDYGINCFVSGFLKYGNTAEGVLDKLSNNIFLHPDNSLRRSRFTIAHELAHIEISSMPGNLKAIACGFSRGDSEETMNAKVEETANFIASAALIPVSKLIKIFNQKGEISELLVIQITAYLDVSLSALTNRLVRLYESNYDDELNRYLLRLPEILENEQNVRSKYKVSVFHNRAQDKASQHFKEFSKSSKKFLGIEAIDTLIEQFLAIGVFSEARNGKISRINSPRDKLGKPFFIEFSGTPNAGKQVQIEVVMEFLQSVMNLSVMRFEDPFRICPIRDSHAHKLHWVWAKSLQNLIEATSLEQYDVVIFDRGMFDVISQFMLYQSQGIITKQEATTHISSSKVKSIASLIDLIFLLLIPPQTSIYRELQFPMKIIESHVGSKPTQNMRNVYGLQLLNQFYEAAHEKYKTNFQSIVKIYDDGNGTVKDISSLLLNSLEDQLEKGRKSNKPPLIKGTLFDKKQPMFPGFEQSNSLKQKTGTAY